MSNTYQVYVNLYIYIKQFEENQENYTLMNKTITPFTLCVKDFLKQNHSLGTPDHRNHCCLISFVVHMTNALTLSAPHKSYHQKKKKSSLQE